MKIVTVVGARPQFICYTAMKERNISFDIDLYGDGNASRHIVKAMIGDS